MVAAAARDGSVLLATATGRDGGRTTGAESGEPAVTRAMVRTGLALFVVFVAVTAVGAWRRPRASTVRDNATMTRSEPIRSRAAPPPDRTY